ncbi:hypothetical protein THRCLA_11696 [Thraustotheca clavata]|uniref:6-pyruvoyltetrahydropterin synthase n=1 Tax=Thraustotheca clavata TaxID=74557 RepID=A0A1V9Y6Z9_9STRA|nr:hypothetical protein THRCLA_11696 [Thraustotheca clavata]
MKFNAAHFIAYKGFRERLHGHNYRLSVTIHGHKVGPDGYVIDFGHIKSSARKICKELNEHFLVPMKSDVLTIVVDDMNVQLTTEDGQKFSFPKADCSFLPIIHSSAEELAIYICGRLIEEFTLTELNARNVFKLEISIAEAENQLASYEHYLSY